ncbi:hypothetical protein [Aquabacterium sp.]|uniref:hypothetical protein n=1 Tax=Aquabacterium sp. TaxID=1872578 RepID=UPI002BEA2A0B|nr:hypothetical protein [Aquabacterium sp.]HSW03318.1 hypothetical protein [Aquabacterium sp.]
MKKNPFMSMWLSSANRAAGTLHGHAAAQAKRQVHAAVADATAEGLKFWTDVLAPASTATRAKRKRR